MAATDLRAVELRHLHALCAVADERSFGRAAVRLGYTQSAVSQQIASLERVVGEALFDRPGGPRPVQLTRAGELLLVHARAILHRMGVAAADLAAYRQGDAGGLAVGTFQSISVRALPLVVGRLRREVPDLRVSLVEHEETGVLVEKLVAGELDCAFVVGEDAASTDVVSTELGHDPFLVMSPAAERLVGADEPVPAHRLGEIPLVAQTANSCQALLERHLDRAGVEPDIVFRTSDNGAVQAMVRSGGCHAVMPRLTIDLDDPGISVHRVEPPIPARRISLASPARRPRPPSVDRFTEATMAVCAELLES